MADKTINQIIGPSPQLGVNILDADFMHLENDLKVLEKNAVSLLHFDVMDGRFVRPLTLGPQFIKSVKTAMLKDVHLMIAEPLNMIPDCVEAGADIITLHVESGGQIHYGLQQIGLMENANDRSRPVLRGIAINPGTPIMAVEPLLDEADIVYLVAINPGFPGQKFIGATSERYYGVKQMVIDSCRRILVGIDGGVTRETIAEIAALGPDIVVAGGMFEGGKIEENLKELTGGLRRAGK